MKVRIYKYLVFVLFSFLLLSCSKYQSSSGRVISKYYSSEKDSVIVIPVIDNLSRKMKRIPSVFPESWNLVLDEAGGIDTVSVKREIFEKVKVGDDVIIYSKIR